MQHVPVMNQITCLNFTVTEIPICLLNNARNGQKVEGASLSHYSPQTNHRERDVNPLDCILSTFPTLLINFWM